MAQFDLGSVLGAMLGGAPSASVRRGKRGAIPGIGGRGGQAQLGRALATLAGVAIEALSKSGQGAPPTPTPAPRAPMPAPARGKPWPAQDGPAPKSAKPTPAPGPWWSGPARGAEAASDSVKRSSGSVPASGGAWATPVPTPPQQAGPSAEHAEALLLIRTMIAAAKADGAVDAEERAGIARQLDSAGLTAAERDFVLADFDRPLSAETLAKEAGDPMLAAQLYAAAYAATRGVSAAERAWLDAFGRALRLDRAALEAIEKRLGAGA